MQRRLTSSRDTPKSCQSSPAFPVNLRRISTTTTTSSTTGYTKAQAKAHDAKLAEATNQLRAAMDRADHAANDIHRAAGDKTGYFHGRRYATWELSLDDAIETARKVAAGQVDGLGNRAAWNLRNAPQRATAALHARDTALEVVAGASHALSLVVADKILEQRAP